jgi:hypothetical protein
MKRKRISTNPNPTLTESREAVEPYSRGQWDSALKATPHSPKGDVSYVRAIEPTARSGAHGFRSRRPRSLLTVLNYCRIRFNYLNPPNAGKPFRTIGIVGTAGTGFLPIHPDPEHLTGRSQFTGGGQRAMNPSLAALDFDDTRAQMDQFRKRRRL